MTGFDETVPPDDTEPADGAAATASHTQRTDEQVPAHDSTNPALEDEPTEDEPH